MKTIHKELFKSTTLIKLVLFLFLGLSTSVQLKSQSSHTITNIGNKFSPDTLYSNVGDNINFNAPGHPVREVDSTTIIVLGLNPLPAGFDFPSGVGTFTPITAGTHWYICSNHVATDSMFGVIYVCNLTVDPTTTSSATDIFTNDGEITVDVTSGAGNFDYFLTSLDGTPIDSILDTPSSTVIFDNLSSGNYIVNVRNKECDSMPNFPLSIDTVAVYPISGGITTLSGFMGYCPPAGANITANFDLCGGASTSLGNQFVLTDILGAPIWDTISMLASASLPPLTANQYILEVTNLDNNCNSINTFSIAEDTLQSNFIRTNPSSATATDGSFIVDVLLGTAPYTMSYNDGSGWTAVSGWSNGDPIPGLSVGTYIYRVTSDPTGCTSQDTVELIFNNCFSTLIPLAICDSFQLRASTTNSFNTVPYNYNYHLSYDGVRIDSIINSSLTNVMFPNYFFDEGQYILEVININTGCQSVDTILVNLNTMSINILPLTNYVSAPGACDGIFQIGVAGGTIPYTITWTDTSGSVINFSVGPPVSTTPLLCENTYCVEVIDGNGCPAPDTCFDMIFSSCNTNLTITDSIYCYGDTTGEITATIDTTSPAGPNTFINRYTYTLYSLNPTTQIGLPFSTNNMFHVYSSLGAGSYRVDVVDSSYVLPFSCLSDSIELIQPDPITAWTTIDSTTTTFDEDGKITIDSITGGSGSYINIIWLDSAGNQFTVPVIDTNISGNQFQDSLGYSTPYNGGYTIMVTDADSSCTNETVVYVYPKNADSITSVDTFYAEDVVCHGDTNGKLYMRPYDVGRASVPPYTYVWIDVDGSTTGLNPGDTMRVDSLGSTWYTGAPSHVATYTNRHPGTYELYAYDYFGNPFPPASFPMTFIVNEPDSLIINLGPDFSIDCGDDTVLTAIPIGGNITNDTNFVNGDSISSSFVLDFTNPNPAGIGDTLMTGGIYILQVSGTFRHDTNLVDHLDAAYDFTDTNEVMLWDFDFTNTHRPSPNTYNSSNNHTYTFPFIGGSVGGIPGMGIHTWSVPSFDYTGELFCTLKIVDTSVHIYNYNWSGINNNGIPLAPPLPGTPVNSTADTCYAYPGSVDTGNYIVQVFDVNYIDPITTPGCRAVDTVKIWWDLYMLDFDSINLTHVVPCYGDSTGKINVFIDSSTGSTPYNYYVEDNLGAIISTLPVSDTTFDLIAGNYTVYLEDSMGCLSNDSIVTITQPDSIWACGNGNTDTEFLIDNFVMNFDTISSAFIHTSQIPTLFGVLYRVEVEGTYGLDFFNFNHKDPAFIISSGLDANDWTVNGSTMRPDTLLNGAAAPYSTTHKYEYTFLGNGDSTKFGFVDPNGSYYGNSGSLTFNFYKIGCPKMDSVHTCSGDSTGHQKIFAHGGVPFLDINGAETYNFTWEDASGVDWTNNSVTSANSSEISGLPAGDYTVTITDSLGCNEYERYLRVLEAPTPLQIDSVNKIDVLCHGDATGKISVYFSGGYGATDTIYKYLTGVTINGTTIDTIYQSTNDRDSLIIDSLIAGYYTLYVWDELPGPPSAPWQGDYFCPQIINIQITEPPVPLSSTINPLLDVRCWGDSSGAASVIAWGGNSLYPYSYLWDNGETTAIADSLWADENVPISVPPSMGPLWQAVTITDSNGCTHRDSIQISHKSPKIQAYNTFDGSNTVQVIDSVDCFNACDAIATISSEGGSGLPHTYFWDIGHVGTFHPDTVTGLCAGGHDIIIEDGDGCRVTVYYQISQPDELLANAHWVDHVDCYGYDNGIAHAFGNGGTTPYTFVWDDPLTQVNDTAYNLPPGIHTVSVTDGKGCMASDTVFIYEPDSLYIVIQDTSTVYAYCTGTNSAYLYSIAFGGTEPYNYVWSDPLGQTTPYADDLMAGTYTVIVLDDNGCSSSDIKDIDSVTNEMNALTAVTDISCFGLFDGSTLVDSVWGGIPLTNTGNLAVDYDYSWTGPNGYTANQQQINFLYAGNYGVTITDSNNCKITIYTNVQEPDALRYTLYDITGSTCEGECDGSISVDVEGGTSPYYYDIFENGIFPIPASDQVQLINDSLILDLCADDYDIYLTDENNCVGTVVWGGVWQATIDPGVIVSVSPPNVTQAASCYNTNDGHANVIFPINPLFTYTWETLGGVVVDTGTHTTILSGGNYNLVAHYADNASFGQVYTACDASVTFTMPSPSQIVASPNSITNELSCYGYTTANGLADGKINVNVPPGISGGNGGPYTYLWDITTSLPNGSTSSTIDALQAGTYTVTITDLDGCTETIDFDIIEPDALTNNFDPIVNASCNGTSDGSVKANPDGGTAPSGYSYSWSPSGGNGQTANGLSANTYTVTVEDDRGCQEDFEITITEPDLLISDVEPNAFYGNDLTGTISYHISCNGFSNGSAIVNLGGGTYPYTFSWKDASGTVVSTNQNTDTILSSGTHTVTVTDNQSCVETMDVTLVEPDLLVVNGTSSGESSLFPGGFDISCKGLNDGACYTKAEGGVKFTGASYTYSWLGPIGSQSSNDTSITDLYTGTYTVTVTDANGCISEETFTLTEPSEEFVSETYLVNYAGASVSPVTADFQDNTVSVDPYNYTIYWPIGDSVDVLNVTNLTDFDELTFTEIGENHLYIKVQNANSGCVDDTTFIVKVQGIPEINDVFTPNGDGVNDYYDFGAFGVKDIDVSIYSRWGEMVINWQDSNYQWDGRGINGEDLPEGVYYYVLIATGEDGHAYQKKGAITLLR